MSIIVANKTGVTDGTAHAFLSRIQTDVPIVLVSRAEGYEFNEDLLLLKGKKFVLVCFVEYGWNWNGKSHYWGINSKEFDFLQGGEWEKFDEFIIENPPALTFKRELLKSDACETVRPIEYPAWYVAPEIQPKHLFDCRPISAMMYWGRSHESRVRVHSEIWLNASKKGYSVCDNIYYFEQFMNEERGDKFVTMWMPHYSRIDVRDILQINSASKIGIALPGAGRKTFRQCEVSINSTTLMLEDKLAYSYEWEDKVNCLKCEEGKEMETIFEALQNPNLYDIYCAGVENNKKYQVDTYIFNYIMPLINKL